MNKQIDYSRIGPECMEMAKFFNSHGLTTKWSCRDHDDVHKSLFWVSFDKSVKTINIVDFQSHYLNEFGEFTACGHFCKRLYLVSQKKPEGTGREYAALGSWEYVAASPEAAKADLERWLDIDKNGMKPFVS